MFTKHAFLMQHFAIPVLMESGSINKENLKIVGLVALLVLMAAGPLMVAVGLYTIIKKKTTTRLLWRS